MHIGRHIIQEVILQLGEPSLERWSFPMEAQEFADLSRVLALGRAHDVTSFILRDDRLAVVRKHGYPAGAYRAPSGGIHPEESFLDGAAREAWEETGLEVHFERYLLRTHVTFMRDGESRSWTTHALVARPVAGEIDPMDVAEIEEARWIRWGELLERVNPILVASGLGGLAYRARLHETVFELLRRGPAPTAAA